MDLSYSIRDIYPDYQTPTTTDKTVPTENNQTADQILITKDNGVVVNHNMIIGAFGLMVGTAVMLHFLK